MLMSAYCVQALAEDDGLPGIELLEFLADWETSDGQWVDPVELDEPVPPASENAGQDVGVQHD
jgi:hypothetical protein